MIKTIDIPEVWKDLKLELKEDIPKRKVDYLLKLELNSNFIERKELLRENFSNKRIESAQRRSANYNKNKKLRLKDKNKQINTHCIIS